MKARSHHIITHNALQILTSRFGTTLLSLRKTLISRASALTDNFLDVEFIDVEWRRNENPHEGNESVHVSEAGNNFTAFNHFIDIKKGHGLFDDYDGYSYKRGSASKDEYQEAIEKTDGFFANLAASITGYMVDEGLSGWWYNDEYVHVNGQPGYENCSPSVEAYSYPIDFGIYPDKTSELKERFPLAKSTGETGMGIPYSVFMPVDNLGRYWYEVFLATSDLRSLGPVMHAIQDASIPHHAAGYLGNWHGEYETSLENVIKDIVTSELELKVMSLLDEWDRLDISPPTRLDRNDWSLVPAINWRIDQLITWVALNAFRSYANTYKYFNICDMPRYRETVRELLLPSNINQAITRQIKRQVVMQIFQETIPEMQNLILIVTAMSSLVLLKAIREKPLKFMVREDLGKIHTFDCRWAPKINDCPMEFDTLEAATEREFEPSLCCLKPCPDEQEQGDYIGNIKTRKLHMKGCIHASRISLHHRVSFQTVDAALYEHYNGCQHCMSLYNLDIYGGHYLIPWSLLNKFLVRSV